MFFIYLIKFIIKIEYKNINYFLVKNSKKIKFLYLKNNSLYY